MHPFFILGAIRMVLVPAVVAFFVLFAASKAEGFVKVLGNVLGYIILIIALVALAAMITAPLFGGHPFGLTGMWDMHPGPHWAGGPPPK